MDSSASFPGHKATTHLHLVPKIRMNETAQLFPQKAL
jgi:hypothetical protein